MCRRIVVVVIALGVALGAARPAAAQPLPRDIPPEVAEIYKHPPVVELVTMGIGSLIWERHGHIALCVRYEDPRDYACYNYGIGDFHEPMKMATGFFRGTNSFWVGKMDPGQMLNIYRHADRTIWVQPLPLTDEQEKKVIDKLEYDILDDHRYYAYDHFWDNCTTRVRGVLDDAIGGELKKWSMQQKTDGRTYRDLAREGFFGMRVPLIITDIAMGRVTDREPNYWERMFLPDYMRDAAEAFWKIKPIVFYQRKGPPPAKDSPSGRIWFSLIILLLTSPAWITALIGKFKRAGLGFAVVPYVFLGSIFWFLAIISPLPYVESNESCLVLLPTDLLLVWFLKPEKRQLYAKIRIGMLALVFLLSLIGVLKQPIWPELLWPLVPSIVVAGIWPRAKK